MSQPKESPKSASSLERSCATPGCDRAPRGRTDICNACRQRAHRQNLKEEAGGRAAGTAVLPPRNIERFLSRIGPPHPVTGCREWTKGRFDDGYGAYTENYQLIGAHRLAYALAHGEVPAGSWVCHHCDNPPCCEPTHLYLGDNDTNVRDRVERQRGRTGERHHAAKLTDEQVIEFRQRYAAGEDSAALCQEAEMTRSAFWGMLVGRLWSHLPGAVQVPRNERQVRGEKAPLAVLTEEQVIEARHLYREGEASYLQLARRYGIDKSAMRQAVVGKTWSHLPGAVAPGTSDRVAARGESAGGSKLSADQVRQMRSSYAAGGVSYSELAASYGISAGTVGKIINRERWAHID